MANVYLTIRNEDGYDDVVGVYFDKDNAVAHARTSLAEELSEALTSVRSEWGADDFELQESQVGSSTHVYVLSPPGAWMAAVYLDIPVFRVDTHEAWD